jgi:hypothetical protein
MATPSNSSFSLSEEISASAATVIRPLISETPKYGDRFRIKVDNYKSFSNDVYFNVYINGKKVKTYTSKSVKRRKGILGFRTDKTRYIKNGTSYKVQVESVTGKTRLKSATLHIKTAEQSWFTIKKGSPIYMKGSGGLYKTYNVTSSKITAQGFWANERGNNVAGKSKNKSSRFVCVTVPVKTYKSGEVQFYSYKTYYVPKKAVYVKSVNQVRNKVVHEAKRVAALGDANTYRLTFETFTSTYAKSDCSGLVKHCYIKVGKYFNHRAASQAEESGLLVYDNTEQVDTYNGEPIYRLRDFNARVDYSLLEKGDLLFFVCTDSPNSNDAYRIGHVGIYVGNGQMIDFTSIYGETNNPCRYEDLDSYQEEHYPICRVLRFIY